MQCKIADCFETSFMIDSGADVNVIAENDFENMLILLESDEIILYDYENKPKKKIRAFASHAPLTIIASFSAWIEAVELGKPRRFAKFLVVKGGERSLLSRSTASSMKMLKLGSEVNNVELKDKDQTETPFPKIPNVIARFEVDPTVPPCRNAYFNVPAAFIKPTADRISKHVRQQIIEKVTKAPRWISGMGLVPKGLDDFRLIVNMKGPNRAILRCYYPLPQLVAIQRKLYGAKFFTKLDLTNAFHHVELDESSRELTTFMAEDGMYRFTRLMFGVNCAPEIFQEIMERILRGIDGVIVYIDDTLIFGSNIVELRERTQKVLRAFKKNNLTLNKSKCEYEKQSLSFLGHVVSAKGMNIEETKVKSITTFREPKTTTELKSFLGLAAYVSTFIPRFGDLTRVLWKTASTKPFHWSQEARQAFEGTKSAIVGCTMTKGFFSDDDKTILYSDASPFALGAVLVQEDSEGNERVISFASKALTATEKAYPQTQREALSIVWAAEHFHYHLRGRHFTIRTDARGIAFIFNRERENTKRFLSRAQGFALRMNQFDFVIEFVKGNFNIADSPSRLYVGEDTEYVERDGPGEIGSINAVGAGEFVNNSEKITLGQMKAETTSDETLQRVMKAIVDANWTNDIKDFKSVIAELYVVDGLLIKTGMIVVPEKLRKRALEISHNGHPGATAMRSILRGRVWWPRMDRDAEEYVQSCNSCTLVSRQGPPTPMIRTLLPSAPWDLLAIDYNGPYAKFGGISIVLIVDCYSRFLSACIVRSTSFNHLKPVLETIFNRYGYPQTLKADNGPPFNGQEYSDYLSSNGIGEAHSTPLFPQQNGTIERYMQLVDKAIQIALLDERDYKEVLAETIRAHNSAKHRVTGISPEELIFNRKVRRNLPLFGDAKIELDTNRIKERDKHEKELAKAREDKKRGAKETSIEVGDTVVILRKSRAKGDSRFDPTQWKVTAKHRGDLELESDGSKTKRNVTMVKKIHGLPEQSEIAEDTEQGENDEPHLQPTVIPMQTERRSTRIRKTPSHLDMYVRLLNGDKFV